MHGNKTGGMLFVVNNILQKIVESWQYNEPSLCTFDELLEWIETRNRTTAVETQRIRLEDSDAWFYDREEGSIRNQKRSFFHIAGYQRIMQGGQVISQPIII